MIKRAVVILDKYLESFHGTFKGTIPEKAKGYLIRAMVEHARLEVSQSQINENKEQRRFIFMLFGHFSKLTWDQFIMFLRMKSLKTYKKIAQAQADGERRKIYTIRSSMIGYKMFSSADVKINKKLRIFGKQVNSVTLTEAADFVAFPRKLR